MANILYRRIVSVAVPMFDEHHRLIADGIMMLSRCMTMSCCEEDKKTLECFENAFKLIKSYVFVHFSCEEAFLQYIHFPHLEQHKRRHQNFIQEAMRIKELVTESDLSHIADMSWFLFTWLVGHINEEDIQYRQYFKGPELIDFMESYQGPMQLEKPDFSKKRMVLDLFGL
ncbi:MAG: hemerythrin family protein [Magnetococcales bacterium]|nr:hemerythrin family protein [Magnetococcales bacterium]